VIEGPGRGYWTIHRGRTADLYSTGAIRGRGILYQRKVKSNWPRGTGRRGGKRETPQGGVFLRREGMAPTKKDETP